MTTKKNKPTRRDLLIAVHTLQGLIGDAYMFHGNDRDPNGFERGQNALKEAERLCHCVLGADPPMDGKRSKWVPQSEEVCDAATHRRR